MKVPISWLREYLDFTCPIDELAEKLTMAGLEVEEISKVDDDTVFDVKVTPNRGDWLSMIGVAREAAPLVDSKLRMPEPKANGSGPDSSESIRIDIENPDLCGRYVGLVVRNVKVGPSPDWMCKRLLAAGMRPINNIVDITNYVMLEVGQPLHAFDLSLLRGSQIIVRTAKPGEAIISLDSTPRNLDSDMLVIADGERPVAIAGVMGGLDSEISEQTEDILIESANFIGTSIRRTSKRLGLVTESSYRFERGVDPSISAIAALRAAELVRELAGGEVANKIIDVHPRPVEPRIVETRPGRVNAVLGTDLDANEMACYLNGLEIETSIENGILVSKVPTFRQDITREIDIAEEVGRAYGYQNLPRTLPKTTQQGKNSDEGLFKNRLRRILISCGAQEVLTHSVVDSALSELAGKSKQSVKLRNPLCEDLDSMRTALIPNILGVIKRNQSFGTSDINIFEIGKVYVQDSPGELREELRVAGAIAGNMWQSKWNLPSEALDTDFYLCKGIIESVLDSLGIAGANYVQTTEPMLHPTRSAAIMVSSRQIGVIGEASPSVRETLDLRERPCVYDLDFNALMELTPKVLKYHHLHKYPALHRHLAVVIPNEVKYSDLTRVIEESDRGVIESITLLDVYTGEQVGNGRSSITVSIVFRSAQKTLTDDEVNCVLEKVKDALTQQLGATFR